MKYLSNDLLQFHCLRVLKALVHAEEVKPHVQISALKDTTAWHTCALRGPGAERPDLLA